MAISFVAVNNAAGVSAGTTTTASTCSLTPALPTGTASGDRVFVFQAHNCATGSAATPANWTALYKDVVVGTGAPSAGGGQRFISCYYRDYDGVWTMPAFTLASVAQNTHSVGSITFRRAANESWNTPTASGVGTFFGTAGTAYTMTTPAAFTTVVNALLIAHDVTNDNVTATAPAISGTNGFALTPVTLTERVDGGSATGNDVSLKVFSAMVGTAGSPAGTLTHTMTLSAASQGGTAFVQQTVAASAVVTPSGATLALTGATPGVTTAITALTPSGVTLPLSGHAPRLDFGIRPSGGSPTLTGQTPTVRTPVTLTPGGGSLPLTGSAPSVTVGINIRPDGITLTLNGHEPTVVNPRRAEPSGATLTLTGSTPVLNVSIRPGASTLTLNGSLPVLGTGLRPVGGSLILTSAAPRLDFSIRPGGGTLSLTGHQSTIGTSFTVDPDDATLTLAGSAPVLGLGIRPTGATLTLTGSTPVIMQGSNVTPAGGTLSLVGHAPSLGLSIRPGAGNLSFSGTSPAVLTPIVIVPSGAGLVLSVATAHLGLGINLRPVAGSLIIGGDTPTVIALADLVIQPRDTELVLTGGEPFVAFIFALTPMDRTYTIGGGEESRVYYMLAEVRSYVPHS